MTRQIQMEEYSKKADLKKNVSVMKKKKRNFWIKEDQKDMTGDAINNCWLDLNKKLRKKKKKLTRTTEDI